MIVKVHISSEHLHLTISEDVLEDVRDKLGLEKTIDVKILNFTSEKVGEPAILEKLDKIVY